MISGIILGSGVIITLFTAIFITAHKDSKKREQLKKSLALKKIKEPVKIYEEEPVEFINYN
ncbi:hypothetical protein A2995_00455 [Candidatus Nomurabacteria bacterium RIFCSPLOWO2_01_FULL_33_24]|uniref:Uncharacterized protein n=1 Tax=Candidatus Nomurabacteria bacterium RIFCSPLOWO2_01_FULL_33_24 TaxID=1801765 RepID=A0A1F6WYP6_9BACT|nr:MAG: hypothetical protein A2995_00455 [Candidatus Nomurabacteria bacterium RIFCSPLOWO2_01_FULL_33_24]